ncbi:23S rRNA (guanosine(2251)-2'-O)-methyltransferase RlmB [Rhodoblastus acidophilus]|uniref:23S rRNA (Guanosine(2251)-2'-O)-methyltransferase RlmB n=1 Tax=Candidatus Rhodoblastus alkanivorans TaxID=2954117 RepID=A0ABS9Z7X6_9HYPH|nr:23S rRNA (guanosine(2251)-2'-O)-methyltransferase RlmB [Candidatus Rhodoblastus alkanivorans]MCI4679660.1 23S rRNA (guanosine(2251)-2'-O)-methyltransferase RlmB [Candidatus Rhodoblastus alkanivorans]MCI4683696.1 23S rRNA (guanosine(2251)-2'-O)-methyltransferase RlmB [Candidatus Rhodoblastus alkanivorans]MDI4641013.1 23S rRNA (guanosine(2251)-2'-O)-methyltransferase RlmB [Rhodoblastus acidophilus]
MKKHGGRRQERSPSPSRTGPGAPKNSPQSRPAPKARAREDKPRAGEDKPGARLFRRPSAELAALYGFHAVREALRNPQRNCLDLFATPAAAEKLGPDLSARGIALHIVEPEALTARLGAEAVHQGVLLEARPLPPLDVSEIARKSGLVLALDQITDPHNVGAILRTAAAFAVDAVIVTERHAPELSGVLAKTASGGLEHAPLVEVVNLARALDQLGEAGYLRVGLDSDGPASLEQTVLSAPVALVLGAEGKGLRRLTREKCDVLARLDMPGAIKSLNVSNACAVALALTRARLSE